MLHDFDYKKQKPEKMKNKVEIKSEKEKKKQSPVEELDWPALIDLVFDELKKDDDDSDYWQNEGRDRQHFKDDLSRQIEDWDQMSEEEQEEII